MTVWQRRVRLLLGVFVVVFAVVLYFAIRQRGPEPPPTFAPRADPNSVLEGTRGRLDQTKGAKQDYAIGYDKLITYSDGHSKLAGVRATFPQRGGRSFLITADSGEVGKDQSHVLLQGHVKVVSDDGLTVEAGEATYTEAEGIVRAPGPVRFTKGKLSGSSVGMTYDKQRDVLWLLDKAVINVASDGKGPATEVRAGAAGWARREKYVRFERGVKMLREGQTLEGDTGTGYLTEDEKRVHLIEMRGNSRILGAPTQATGALKGMRARDINLQYAETADTLERATLAGTAAIDITGETPKALRHIAAGWLDLGFAPDGSTINTISAHDDVQLDLPAEGDVPARSVRASGMQGAGPPGRAVTKVDFQGEAGEVEFRETRAAPDPPIVARSKTMELTVTPGFGSVDDARFFGGARLENGDMRGSARDARYAASRGVLGFSGDQEGRPPHVVKDRATIEATQITVTLEGQKIEAIGAVRSVMLPEDSAAQPASAPVQPAGRRTEGAGRGTPGTAQSSGAARGAGTAQSTAGGAGRGAGTAAAKSGDTRRTAAGAGQSKTGSAGRGAARSGAAQPPAQPPAAAKAPQPPAQTKVPGLLKQDQVTNATADVLKYDSAGGHAVYTGKPARLWQADTSIYGNEITVDDQKGNLHAVGSVVTTLMLDQVDDKTQKPAKADDLVYDDDLRRATYTTNAQMTGPQGNLAADRIEMFLAQGDENRLERVEAYAAVTVRPGEGRVATGDRLTYFAADERYVMTGAQVKITEEDRETTGKTLTFFKSADRIIVDGNEERRTQTKGGAKKEPLPRFD